MKFEKVKVGTLTDEEKQLWDDLGEIRQEAELSVDQACVAHETLWRKIRIGHLLGLETYFIEEGNIYGYKVDGEKTNQQSKQEAGSGTCSQEET